MQSANEVQDEILAVMRDLHPRTFTQTHSEMARMAKTQRATNWCGKRDAEPACRPTAAIVPGFAARALELDRP